MILDVWQRKDLGCDFSDVWQQKGLEEEQLRVESWERGDRLGCGSFFMRYITI
jgi:hypothetical protein